MGVIAFTYVIFLLVLILADMSYTSPNEIINALKSEEIQYSIKLSLISCTITMILSLIVAIPLGYFMARYEFRFKKFIDAVLDIPIILPPLVIGLSLLILFNQTPLKGFLDLFGISVSFTVVSVIIAQFTVACAFAIRTMYITFLQINNRQEQVALTLGCNQRQSFFYVLLPQAKNGILTAGALAWARALGEFGPLLIFSGSTRMRTEVLSVSVYLEITTGKIEAAVAVSIIMIISGFAVLMIVRMFGDSKKML
jgi:molybdate transport system permease protein|tara:strand:- start:151 stop:912 length:762 start_codon:yes stop_codon:yes gene_type:complete